MAVWKWTLARPEAGDVLPCAAGNYCAYPTYCAYPKKNHKPGNSYGYWVRGTIRLRTCSKICAEIFIQKFEEGALLGMEIGWCGPVR